MSKKKYLRKNEFRLYENPDYLSKSKEPHPAYITARYKRKYKANVITHSKKFFGKDTLPLSENPNKNKDKYNYTKESRISVSFWDKDSNFSDEKLSGWRFSKIDKKRIKKWNKKNQP